MSSDTFFSAKGLTGSKCAVQTERKDGSGEGGGAEKECQEAESPSRRESQSAEGSDSPPGGCQGLVASEGTFSGIVRLPC